MAKNLAKKLLTAVIIVGVAAALARHSSVYRSCKVVQVDEADETNQRFRMNLCHFEGFLKRKIKTEFLLIICEKRLLNIIFKIRNFELHFPRRKGTNASQSRVRRRFGTRGT